MCAAIFNFLHLVILDLISRRVSGPRPAEPILCNINSRYVSKEVRRGGQVPAPT